MIATALDTAQQRAVDASLEDALAIVGGPATGRTTALLARLDRARASGVQRPLVAVDERASSVLHALASALLADAGTPVRIVDDVEGGMLFAEAAAPLLAMESDLIELDIDPEVPGLRSPERFLRAAYRLERRLVEALFTPDAFLERALAGATEFYAKPPNFALPDLIAATKSEHRASLAVSPEELQRQYRREIDLAKLLAQLFRAHAALLERRACATGRDAVAAAVSLMERDAAFAQRARARHDAAFLDDAGELTRGELALLASLFGKHFRTVTLVSSVAGEIAPVVELRHCFRPRPKVQISRPQTHREEAREVAAHVADLIAAGARPESIAVLVRSVSTPEIYESALLARGIPVQIGGDYNVFADRRALDALALLWNVHDPYRHDWLLRTLEGDALALSDASLAVLCGEPAEKQTVLFEEDAPPSPSVAPARDPDRDVRLARNVLRGDADASLSPLARGRVTAFRATRERWESAAATLPFDAFVRLVWSEGLARDGAPGSARALAQQRVLAMLLERLERFRVAHPDATLGAVLEDAERRAESSLETCEAPEGDGVRLLSVPCARGMSFEHVAIANVRPGSFPRWYAPDAFLFSPKLGMIPKDNAGDATTARTAKFTYYAHKAKPGAKYNERERRLWNDALSRARTSLLVTAFGRPTRGRTAPEFLEELR